jgi:uncharacterized protein YjiS (DUF1127 family)
MREGHASRPELARQAKRRSAYLMSAKATRNSCRRWPDMPASRRNFRMLPMNAHTTKAAEAFFFPEAGSASTTGLMLSLSRAARAMSEWSRRRRMIAELQALTDRELADIGLTRGDIGNVIRGQR